MEMIPERRGRAYSWSLAWVRYRIDAHRRAAAATPQAHMQRFYAQQADQWESHLIAFRESRGLPNVRVLDWYRPPPDTPV